MTDIELITKVLKSKKPSDIFNGEWKKDYLRYSKLIHPDACTQPNAGEAMSIINKYKSIIENGVSFVDETGNFVVFDKKIEYVVTDLNRKLLTKSVNNYRVLMSKNDEASKHFKRFLPKEMILTKDKLVIHLNERSIPLTNNKLSQIHVNWIFSRMFEFQLWLKQVGFVHMGLNPTTVFVVPETHGIVVVSFYHMTKLWEKTATISAKYKMWYPTHLFTNKKATADIDLELIKKIAIYLLGDRSAGGTKLKMDKTNVNQEILSFLLTKHENTFDDFKTYRKIIDEHFEKKFYVLDL